MRRRLIALLVVGVMAAGCGAPGPEPVPPVSPAPSVTPAPPQEAPKAAPAPVRPAAPPAAETAPDETTGDEAAEADAEPTTPAPPAAAARPARREGPLPLPPAVALADWPFITVAPPAAGPGHLAPLQAELEAMLAGNSRVGVHVYDFTTGHSAGVNARQPFWAASTFKLPIVMYILDVSSRGRLDLLEELAYHEDDYETGTGVLWQIQTGDRLSVHRLLELSITHSDNIATNMLLRRFGRRQVWDYMLSLGAEHTNAPEPLPAPPPPAEPLPGENNDDDSTASEQAADADAEAEAAAPPQPFLMNVTSAQDMTLFLRILADSGTYLPAYRDWVLTWLENARFRSRLPAGLPADVRAANKIGTLYGDVHDVGIVINPDGSAYAIAVLTRGLPLSEAEATIARIAGRVHEHMGRQ